MNIIHITHGKVNPFGESGMSRTVYYLNKHQKLAGHNSQIWSVVDRVKKHETYERDEFVNIEMFPRIAIFKYAHNEIIDYIKKNKDKIDIIHFHLMWMLDKNIIAHKLKKLNIPYIVTTHGAYTKDKIMEKWWKKLPAKYIYELDFLNNALAIHAVAYEELTALREFGVKVQIFVVSNGIEMSETREYQRLDNFYTNCDLGNKVKFIWIGNFKLCKNIDGLIKAVSLIPQEIREELVFLLIGPEGLDAKGYLSHIKSLVKQYRLENQIHFIEPLYGKAKYRAIKDSDIYVHPSWSEVISFSVIEAMACGKPCLITRTSNISYLYKHDFFVMVEPWPEDIARGIIEIIERKSEWSLMGINAKQYVEANLNWSKISDVITSKYKIFVSNAAKF